MRRSPPTALAFAALGSFLVALGGCSSPPAEDPSLLFERVWVDSEPAKPTDYMHVAFLVPDPAIGIFQRASAYEVHAERFDHRREGQTLKLTFPQTGKTAEVRFTVTACNTLPPYDLCLELSDNPWGGPKRFFGKRQQDEEDARLRGLRAQVARR